MTSTSDVLEQIDDAIADWELGPDAVRFNAPEEARLERPRWSLPDWLLSLLADRVLVIVEQLAGNPMIVAMAAGHMRSWVRVHDLGRCPGCSPMANPPKLPIDGAEYSRRIRARRRR